MSLSSQQQAVAAAAKAGKNMFVTGSGGVGKTYLLKHMLSNALRYKHVEVTAYTGVAALPIDGTTLHSFLGIKPGDYRPQDYVWQARAKRRSKSRIRNAETLVIDEISMCDAQLLNVADHVMKALRECDKPFGGCQIIALGDFLQLPPPEDDARMCYDSSAWRDAEIGIHQLTEVFRQKDQELIGHLQRVRMGDLSLETIKYFQSCVRQPAPEDLVTELYARNTDVNRRNAEELARIDSPVKTYEAADEGDFWAVQFLQNNCIAPTQLDLKVGARVMLLKNHPKEQLVNGSIGVVTRMEDAAVSVAFRSRGETQTVKLEPEEWSYVARGRSEASRMQIPLRLAYAQTIHKSQGQTLSAALVDMNKIFAKGHGYTGLSRVSGPEGLYLTGFNPFMVKTCQRTVELYRLIDKSEPGFCLTKTSKSIPLREDYKHPERREEQ